MRDFLPCSQRTLGERLCCSDFLHSCSHTNQLTVSHPIFTSVKMDRVDAEALAIALRMLKAGEATLSEAASSTGLSRQLLHYWCARESIDWRRARAAWLAARITRHMGLRPLRARKAGLRRLATEAKAEWDRTQAERQADVSPLRSPREA